MGVKVFTRIPAGQYPFHTHPIGDAMHTDLASFLLAKDAAGLSRNTLHWYEMFVRRYLDWSDVHKAPIKKPETVEAFLASLRKRNLSAFTISGCYRALSVYYKWLVQRGKLHHSPLSQVQAPRTPKQRKRNVSATQFQNLYDSITGHSWIDYRDRAALLILFYSGLRANELLGLRVAGIDYERRILHVMAGKGGADRDVPFIHAAADQLRDYLCSRPASDEPYLFLAGNRHLTEAIGPLTYSGLTQMVRRRCARLGIPRINLHSFRHGYAMLFLNEGGMELGAVSQTMGHSSVEVTRRFYADYATVALRERYDEALTHMGQHATS
jgi:site-specific recombinase XerD